MFRRAAECLQAGLQVDGALFSDGLIGFHGTLQLIAELEQELEREMVQRPWREPSYRDAVRADASSRKSKEGSAGTPLQQQEISGNTQRTATRVYTSPEYQRGVYVERPAEILGMCTRSLELGPETVALSESTKGMARVDEGFLQRLMVCYPDGNV